MRIRFATRPALALCPGSSSPTHPISSGSATSIKRSRRTPAALSNWAKALAPSALCILVRQRRKPWPFTETNYRGFKDYFSGFGFGEAFRTAEDNAKYPLDPYTPLPLEELTVERLRRVKYALAGTPGKSAPKSPRCRRSTGARVNWWFGWFFDQGFMSWDETQRQFEFFAKEIIPHFR